MTECIEFLVHESQSKSQHKWDNQIHWIGGEPCNGRDENYQNGNSRNDRLDEPGFAESNKQKVGHEHGLNHDDGRVECQWTLP